MANNFIQWFKSLLIPRDKYKHLLHYELFLELNAHQRKLVADLLHPREFKAGESVFEKGYPLEVIYFIESGEMELTPLFREEGQVVLGKHQVVGVLDFFGDKKRLCSARAITDLSLSALSANDLQELLNRDPVLGVKILRSCCSFLSKYIRDHAQPHRS